MSERSDTPVPTPRTDALWKAQNAEGYHDIDEVWAYARTLEREVIGLTEAIGKSCDDDRAEILSRGFGGCPLVQRSESTESTSGAGQASLMLEAGANERAIASAERMRAREPTGSPSAELGTFNEWFVKDYRPDPDLPMKEKMRLAWNAARGSPSATTSMKWPEKKLVGRMGEMAPAGDMTLMLGLQDDGDVIVEVHETRHGQYNHAQAEFCTIGPGGGKSPRTREALIALMVAIEADNVASPNRAWPIVAPADSSSKENP